MTEQSKTTACELCGDTGHRPCGDMECPRRPMTDDSNDRSRDTTPPTRLFPQTVRDRAAVDPEFAHAMLRQELGFEPPTKHALAQAFCLVACASRHFDGCTFDGHSCDDRYGDTAMRQAWEALEALAKECQEQPNHPNDRDMPALRRRDAADLGAGRSPAHTAYRRGKSAGYSVGLIDGWDACMRQVGDAFDRAVAVALTEPEAVRKHREAVLEAQRGKDTVTNV